MSRLSSFVLLRVEFDIPAEKELLAMVRQVSQDKTFDTIEFNEFLTMLGKQNSENIKLDSLVEAFGSVDFFSRN